PLACQAVRELAQVQTTGVPAPRSADIRCRRAPPDAPPRASPVAARTPALPTPPDGSPPVVIPPPFGNNWRTLTSLPGHAKCPLHPFYVYPARLVPTPNSPIRLGKPVRLY